MWRWTKPFRGETPLYIRGDKMKTKCPKCGSEELEIVFDPFEFGDVPFQQCTECCDWYENLPAREEPRKARKECEDSPACGCCGYDE